jgi:hypothetical protein
MALIKFGGGITAMSGSIAGNTFARNRFGYYSRARTKPVNSKSSLQSSRRLAVAYLAEYYHETLTSAQRIAWATYANAISMKNRLGESIKLTGFNMFMRSNAFRLTAQNSLTPNGPTALSLPDKDTAFAVAASATTQLLSITWTKGLPWTEIPASVMGVFMGRPQLVTRNFFNGPWKFAGTIAGNCPDSPKTMAPPMTLVLGQKVWVYARISTGPLDSRLSQQMVADCVVGA